MKILLREKEETEIYKNTWDEDQEDQKWFINAAKKEKDEVLKG